MAESKFEINKANWQQQQQNGVEFYVRPFGHKNCHTYIVHIVHMYVWGLAKGPILVSLWACLLCKLRIIFGFYGHISFAFNGHPEMDAAVRRKKCCKLKNRRLIREQVP